MRRNECFAGGKTSAQGEFTSPEQFKSWGPHRAGPMGRQISPSPPLPRRPAEWAAWTVCINKRSISFAITEFLDSTAAADTLLAGGIGFFKKEDKLCKIVKHLKKRILRFFKCVDVVTAVENE